MEELRTVVERALGKVAARVLLVAYPPGCPVNIRAASKGRKYGDSRELIMEKFTLPNFSGGAFKEN
ncbi:hypothetical protein VH13_07615 [Corynebacterium ulcerans]|nr:hypothetical protein VH13_07615 [Corynebacterium ulcerans]KKO85629.1 hypothetical protein VH15_09595 [Corynebacterium ulcerans]